ncbi:MAG: chemotaxis protein CheA, partial [Pseudomonadota bacterium]
MESVWRIDFMPQESLFATGNEPLLILRELARLGKTEVTTHTASVPEIAYLNATSCYLGWEVKLTTSKSEATIFEVFEFVSDHCVLKIAPISLMPIHTETSLTSTPRTIKPIAVAEESGGRVTQTTSIRVDIEKVDRLVNMVGELVITEAMIKAQIRDFPAEQLAGLMRGINELSQHTRELQEAVMGVRMQPVKTIFSRMPRIVRDISAQLNKNIRLLTSGENTE